MDLPQHIRNELRVEKTGGELSVVVKKPGEDLSGRGIVLIGAALKCAPIMEWEFILASGRSSF